ncbi:LysR family transcriptional regulator [Cypionkella sinensis]|uniref:LysR family transcriptional regulator n=1 Tax=Cypionkella sinensis TaxID=1756043 RepID=A0ABV7J415_9RHOB
MHQIKYFLAVTRTLNFTRAADQCNVTQPSLTRAIQKLEDEFGGILFNRERALTHLTELGRMVLPHLEQTYEAAEAATLLANSIGKAEVTPLVIGVADGLHLPVMDDILANLATTLPALTLDVRGGTSAQVLDAALKGGIDLVIIAMPEQAPDRLETWPLFQQRYAVAVAAHHRGGNGQPIAMAEVAAEPWIDCGDAGTAIWRNAACAMGSTPTFRHKVESRSQALRLAALGLGHVIVPAGLAAPGLRVVSLSDCELYQKVVLGAVAGRRRGYAAEAFLRAARARDWQPVGTDPAGQVGLIKLESAQSTAAGSAL